MPSLTTMRGAWEAKATAHEAEAADAHGKGLPGCAWVFDCARRDALAQVLLCDQVTLDSAESSD